MTIVIEQRHIDRDYGFAGVLAIVDHDTLGRILITDGYGGESTVHGGAVRWRHGIACRVHAHDTIDALMRDNYDDCTSLQRALSGYDDTRPVIDISGDHLAQIAKSLNL